MRCRMGRGCWIGMVRWIGGRCDLRRDRYLWYLSQGKPSFAQCRAQAPVRAGRDRLRLGTRTRGTPPSYSARRENEEGQVPQVPVPGKTRPSAEGGLQPVKSSPPRGRVPKVHVPLHRLIANVPSPAHPALPATFPSRRRKTACEGTGTSGTCPQGKPDFRPMPGSSHKN